MSNYWLNRNIKNDGINYLKNLLGNSKGINSLQGVIIENTNLDNFNYDVLNEIELPFRFVFDEHDLMVIFSDMDISSLEKIYKHFKNYKGIIEVHNGQLLGK